MTSILGKTLLRNVLVVISLCTIGLVVAGTANAAPYEVAPTDISAEVNPPITIWTAFVFDNTTGKIYRCKASMVPRSLSVVCGDMKKFNQTTLPTSPDLLTVVQPAISTLTIANSYPMAGLWQINSATGDLQFCTATPRPLNLNNGCVKVDWKGSSEL
jgi:hypothetical protein